MPELCQYNARELIAGLAAGTYSATELMTETLARIKQLNPSVNALCTVIDEDRALQCAAKADTSLRSSDAGPLCGVPMAVKDLSLTKGIRTTFGSAAFSDNVPDQNSLMVQRLVDAGAIIVGKTNTPEFGAGSHTFNEVFGTTRNPYDLNKCAGGSSGGAASALATRLVALADGSDMGGSLRNPAAFCNVVGFRPSIGRVPHWPNPMAWQCRLGVEGPMARSVADAALLLSVMAGYDARDPLSLSQDPAQFSADLNFDFTNARIAWTPDLGMLPVETMVQQTCEASLQQFIDLGAAVENAQPDLSGAMEVFRVLRAAYYAQTLGPLLETQGDLVKQTLAQNIAAGLGLSAQQLTQADVQRTGLFEKVLGFFQSYDFLVLPATQVQPFDCDVEWITEIEGTKMQDYLDWMSICCVITVLGLPAISVPCGFTRDGLPVGLQIVGPPRADLAVLQLAHMFEQCHPWYKQAPDITQQQKAVEKLMV